eukprot:7601767-Pyramimonas_sp.AAC.1
MIDFAPFAQRQPMPASSEGHGHMVWVGVVEELRRYSSCSHQQHPSDMRYTFCRTDTSLFTRGLSAQS